MITSDSKESKREEEKCEEGMLKGYWVLLPFVLLE